jgi:hypothetical protein
MNDLEQQYVEMFYAILALLLAGVLLFATLSSLALPS